MKEILAAIGLASVTAVGKMKFIELFTKIKEHNTPLVFANALKSTHSNFSLLKELAAKTKTSIDDGLVQMVLDAVAEVAKSEGIGL